MEPTTDPREDLMAWTFACRRSDITPLDPVRVEVTPPVAVFEVDGEYLATSDTCTHEDFPLSDGYVDGAVVECSLHMAKFCLRTGAVLGLPATAPLDTYAVRVDGDDIYVDVTTDTPADTPADAPASR